MTTTNPEWTCTLARLVVAVKEREAKA